MHPSRFRPGGKANIPANDRASWMQRRAERTALELEQYGPVFGYRRREESSSRPSHPAGGTAQVVGIKTRAGIVPQSHRNPLHDRRESGPMGGERVGENGAEFGLLLRPGRREENRKNENDQQKFSPHAFPEP